MMRACAVLALLATGAALEVGDPYPDFSLTAATFGGTLTDEDLIGTPTVISIYAATCGHCRAQTEDLEEIWTGSYQADGAVRFVIINMAPYSSQVSLLTSRAQLDVIATTANARAACFLIAFVAAPALGRWHSVARRCWYFAPS